MSFTVYRHLLWLPSSQALGTSKSCAFGHMMEINQASCTCSCGATHYSYMWRSVASVNGFNDYRAELRWP